MENHTLCTKYYSNITSEDECKKAAHKLDLKYGNNFTGPTDFPGCLFADDERQKVFFNLSPDADNSINNKNYTALCKNSNSSDTGITELLKIVQTSRIREMKFGLYNRLNIEYDIYRLDRAEKGKVV